MIIIGSILIRSTIAALVVMISLGASELHGIAFCGRYCVMRDDGRDIKYVPTDLFGRISPWAACVYLTAILLILIAAIAFLAWLDFSING